MLSNREPSFTGQQKSAISGLPQGTTAMTECETIELLLLRNRGAIDAPEMYPFERSVVMSVFCEILSNGYLRSLDSIPAMQVFERSFARYVFSAAGRIRFYHLERLEADSSSGSQSGDAGSQPASTS